MPIDGPSSYLITVPLFLNHWADANALGTPILLDAEATGQATEVDVDALGDLFSDLQGARETLETTLLDLALGSATLLQHKTWLQAQSVSFNQAIRANHGATIYASALPLAPQVNEGREKFLKPLRQVASLWVKVNAYRAALTVPKPALVLQDGTTLAGFQARLEAARVAYNEMEERDQQATLEREMRNAVQAAIYPILKVYRLQIAASFAPNSPIVATLPALTDDGSATPQAGGLTATFEVATNEAVLTGTPSASTSVVRHQLRATLGLEPDVADESVQATFAKGETITLSSAYGLGVPGAQVNYRLVAITADGHERGTDWVSLVRPL